VSEHEPDQEPGAPHPRRTYVCFGHDRAEQTMANALNQGGRLHHAWLLTGPKGVGKATLAYRFARRLLGSPQHGARPLDVAEHDAVAVRIAALSHPDLFVLRRVMGDRGKLRRDVTVEDARELSRFLTMQPAEGGWRVGIVDSVDELNRNAANAILKTLEEPPKRTVLLLICHAPGAALATIRSRCRRLALKGLPEDSCAAAVRALGGAPLTPRQWRLADGRPGRALMLQASHADSVWDACAEALERSISGRPHAFDTLTAGAPTAAQFQLIAEITQYLLRAACAPRGGEQPLSNISVDVAIRPSLALAWSEISKLREQADALGLDPAHAILRLGVLLDQQLRRRQATR